LVIVITNLPPIWFPVVLLFFGLWFIVATGRGVTAQAMVSSVVEAEKRGSFMSFNSSVQQLGTGASSLIAGFVVLEGEGGKILRYSWLGYLSVVVLLFCAWLGYKIFVAQESAGINERTADAFKPDIVTEH
jgi:predicted MFS family arabinose efflux permease